MPRSGLQTDVSGFGICHKVFSSSFNSRAKPSVHFWLARVPKRCGANIVLARDWPLAIPHMAIPLQVLVVEQQDD